MRRKMDRLLLPVLIASISISFALPFMASVQNSASVFSEAADQIEEAEYAALEVNGNIPYFDDKDLSKSEGTIELSELDELGRCGSAFMIAGAETMPDEERGEIGMIKPSGWHTIQYPDIIKERYLYNRSHLLMYALSGINSDERNLITGTRYFNATLMLEYENQVLDYIQKEDGVVAYRVTPAFEDNDLVAKGVLMEAEAIGEKANELEFCVWIPNVQPGIYIDYATGDSYALDGSYGYSAGKVVSSDKADDETEDLPFDSDPAGNAENARNAEEYIVNENTKKFHYPSCSGAKQIKDKNKREVTCSREELIEEGYEPCGMCKP